jgi:hypothetical protein
VPPKRDEVAQMKTIIGFAMLVGLMICPSQRPLLAQACQDEQEMVKISLKDLTDLVDVVKKENVTDFQNHYHQKSYLSKATFLVSVVGGLTDCLDKAAQDSTATKEQVESYKAKQQTFAKLKSKVEKEKNAVKSTQEAKGAKALIEKSDLST